MSFGLEIREIGLDQARKVRHVILRPGRDFETTRFGNDDYEGTFHLGAFKKGELSCILSICPEDLDGNFETGGFRLRGMATIEKFQGQGFGGKLLRATFARLQEKNAKYLWCNARVVAQRFYERYGFQTQGDVFDIPDVGPHYIMIKHF